MNLYLIGYRGSGKTSVAPVVANLLDWDWLDTDKQIELLRGQSIKEIFEKDGETGFRSWETTVIQACSQENEQVISLGGGAPTIDINRTIFHSTGKTVWLTAPAKILWQRIQNDRASDAMRPNLTRLGGIKEIEFVLDQRREIYEKCSDFTVDTTEQTVEQIAEAIANWFDTI